MVEPLRESIERDDTLRAALPVPTASLAVRLFDGLRVLALRHLPGAGAALDSALATHGGWPLPNPGECLGGDPWWLWAGPAECLLITSNSAVADGVTQSMKPGREALACAVDRSSGSVVFELAGAGVAELLPRLFDASAIPQQVGQGHRARCLDVGAVPMRVAPDRVLLLVDRQHGLHLAQWIAHAALADA